MLKSFSAIMFALTIGVACRSPRSVPGAADPIRPAVGVSDSVRGRISMGGAGTCVSAAVHLTTKENELFVLNGSRDVFAQLIGMEVVVFGKRRNPPPNHPYLANPIVTVDSFLIRAADDTPTREGVLRRIPQGDVLETPDGRRLSLPTLPPALAKADGMRVWIAGPLNAPTSAGFIDPKRRYACPE
jgi:hypothetical protein